jgi:TrmH family RNA methyltransferase
MERISSRQNPLVRRFRALADGRRTPDAADGRHVLVLLDGEHLLREALASRVTIEIAAFVSASRDGTLAPLADQVSRHGARVVTVTPSVLAAMSPVRQPSGVVAIAALRKSTVDDAFARAPQLTLLLSDVQDPGNVGAVVRAGEACGVTGIVAGEGTADPYSWKALRGSMGSTLRVPVAARVPLAEAARTARSRGISVVAAVPRDGDALSRADLRRPSAILLGGEGSGLPASLLELADARVSIPMREPVESLNVSVAAALIAYEASRQREGTSGEPVR